MNIFMRREHVNLNKALLIFMLFVATALFVQAKINAPDRDDVVGIYRNDCCADFIFKDGHVEHGSSKFDYSLHRMKFGLTAYVDARFSKDGGVISSEKTAISFSVKQGKLIFEVPIAGQSYTFEKNEFR